MKFNFTNLDYSVASLKGSQNQGGTVSGPGTSNSTNFASMLRNNDAPAKKTHRMTNDNNSSMMASKDPRIQKTR